MRICIAMYNCSNLGGIINHTENLLHGLAELGHDVYLRELVWKTSVSGQRSNTGHSISQQGIPFSQGHGWTFPAHMRLAYRGNTAREVARAALNQFDLVIWTVPVPPKNKENEGNTDWLPLYDLTRPRQIVFSHDGNASKNYPHILALVGKVHGLACVHHCALNTCDFVPIPRALVVNPQKDPVRSVPVYAEREFGFMAAQTFKAWKRVHELVEAIRYMPPPYSKEIRRVIGGGIEQNYMTSPDKCKPQYIHRDGKRFWNEAVANGMEHSYHLPYEDIERLMQRCMAFVDPSWSTRYSAAGGHYNRVVVEAMINGCVPVARKMGMGTELFVAGEHYVEIPEGCDAQTYADVVMRAATMDRVEWKKFQSNNLELLPMFERKAVAQRLIDLAAGELQTETGVATVVDVAAGRKIMSEFYGFSGVHI